MVVGVAVVIVVVVSSDVAVVSTVAVIVVSAVVSVVVCCLKCLRHDKNSEIFAELFHSFSIIHTERIYWEY